MIKTGLKNRFGGILLVYILFVGISFLSRTVLFGMSFAEVNTGIFKSA
jgi:hypothetical protein